MKKQAFQSVLSSLNKGLYFSILIPFDNSIEFPKELIRKQIEPNN